MLSDGPGPGRGPRSSKKNAQAGFEVGAVVPGHSQSGAPFEGIEQRGQDRGPFSEVGLESRSRPAAQRHVYADGLDAIFGERAEGDDTVPRQPQRTAKGRKGSRTAQISARQRWGTDSTVQDVPRRAHSSNCSSMSPRRCSVATSSVWREASICGRQDDRQVLITPK